MLLLLWTTPTYRSRSFLFPPLLLCSYKSYYKVLHNVHKRLVRAIPSLPARMMFHSYLGYFTHRRSLVFAYLFLYATLYIQFSMYNRCINCIINSKKVNAVYFAIHPLPTEDRRFLAHGVLKKLYYLEFYWKNSWHLKFSMIY